MHGLSNHNTYLLDDLPAADSPARLTIIPARASIRLRYWVAACSCVLVSASMAEPRVTTAITLPFQQPAAAQSSEAAQSSASVPVYALTPVAGARTISAPAPAPTIAAAPVANAQNPTSQTSVSPAPASPEPVSQLSTAKTPVAQTPGVDVAANSPATKPALANKPAVAAAPATTKSVPAKPAQASPGPVASIVPQYTAPVKSVGAFTTAQMHAVEMPANSGQAFVKEFETYIEREVAPYVPGVAVAIMSQGQLKSLRAFGVRTAGTRNMLTPDTVFRLASSSKPVAATAIAMYTRSGKLSLDDKVTQVLPNVVFKQPRHGNQVTLRHLLSQGVGLPQHSNSSAIDIGISYAESVRRLRLVNFICAPGKCYGYQNVTYSLAGDMVAQKAGRAFESVVEDLLFGPLGMHSASFGRASYLASPNRATPHIAQGSRWVPTDVTENWYRVGPAAGVNASIVDMARFGLAQLGRRGDVVNVQTLNLVQARVQPNTKGQSYYASRDAVSNTAYGLGWRVFNYGSNKNYIHHGGWVKGFRTEMVFNRELGIGMVFLSNSESRLARDVVFKFIDMHVASQRAARKAR